MVVYYKVFGRQVGSHVLAITTLNSMATIAWLATRGDSKPKANTPPIQATSKDEENFINDFMKQMEQEDKKAKAH